VYWVVGCLWARGASGLAQAVVPPGLAELAVQSRDSRMRIGAPVVPTRKKLLNKGSGFPRTGGRGRGCGPSALIPPPPHSERVRTHTVSPHSISGMPWILSTGLVDMRRAPCTTRT
jgi:hypothetical protein